MDGIEKIKLLCMEGESSCLDFKRDQYAFVNVEDSAKGELLKDILAMANTSRNQTAYILIGVDQEKNGEERITGIAKDQYIDDANLQQFVNGKTNHIIHFSSYPVPIDAEKVIQVIEIPVQRRRPYYPLKQLGKIKAEEVVIRMGSSTRRATPDDIAEMGKEELQKQNQLDIEISLIVKQNMEKDIDFHAIYILPETSLEETEFIYPSENYISPIEKLNWIKNIYRTIRVDIGLKNKSSMSAEQLNGEILVKKCSYNCVSKAEGFPPKPSNCCSHDKGAETRNIQKTLHPGQYDSSFITLYFEVNQEGRFILDVTVYGKDIQPIHKEFTINVFLEQKSLKNQIINTLFYNLDDENSYLQLRKGNEKSHDKQSQTNPYSPL